MVPVLPLTRPSTLAINPWNRRHDLVMRGVTNEAWGGMRGLFALGTLILGVAAPLGAAHAEPCARADFEAVVDQASATLVDVTQKNTPLFQGKLRALKDKRGWSNDQLMKDGAAFVRDDTIARFDEKSEQLLIKINTQAGDSAGCAALNDLKATMSTLVETQTAKWAYMFDKIDKELAK
jgi:hypothetical protein